MKTLLTFGLFLSTLTSPAHAGTQIECETVTHQLTFVLSKYSKTDVVYQPRFENKKHLTGTVLKQYLSKNGVAVTLKIEGQKRPLELIASRGFQSTFNGNFYSKEGRQMITCTSREVVSADQRDDDDNR